MADFLDIRIITFLSGIISLILFLFLLSIYRSRKTYRGFLYWTAAAFLVVPGAVLISLRGYIPDFLSIVCANSLIATTYLLIAIGLIRFSGIRWKNRFVLVAPLAVQILFFYYFTYVSFNVDARILTTSGIGLWYVLVSLYVTARYIPRILHETNWPLLVTLGLLAFYSVFRVIYTVFNSVETTDFMQYPFVHGLNMLILIVSYLSINISLIILNFQRVEHDLRNSMDEVNTLRGLLPICSVCKKIRDAEGYWEQIEEYISNHSAVTFSHGICDECAKKYYSQYVTGNETPDGAVSE